MTSARYHIFFFGLTLDLKHLIVNLHFQCPESSFCSNFVQSFWVILQITCSQINKQWPWLYSSTFDLEYLMVFFFPKSNVKFLSNLLESFSRYPAQRKANKQYVYKDAQRRSAAQRNMGPFVRHLGWGSGHLGRLAASWAEHLGKSSF